MDYNLSNNQQTPKNYSKKNLWKWILLYVVIAAVAYGAVYYFFFYKKSDYMTQNHQSQTENKTENWFEIKEVGLKFKISDDTKDLIYQVKINEKNGSEDIGFSTQSLLNMDKNCTADFSPLGVITISMIEPADFAGAQSLIQSEDFYVTYYSPQATCSGIQAVMDLQTKQIGSLRKALNTITKMDTTADFPFIVGDKYAHAKVELAKNGWTPIPKTGADIVDPKFPEIGDCGQGYNAVCHVAFKKGDKQNHLNVGQTPIDDGAGEWIVIGNE